MTAAGFSPFSFVAGIKPVATSICSQALNAVRRLGSLNASGTLCDDSDCSATFDQFTRRSPAPGVLTCYNHRLSPLAAALLRSNFRLRITGGAELRYFDCHSCGQPLYFESLRCHGCGSRTGFLPDICDLITLTGANGGNAPMHDLSRPVRFCENAQLASCNWLIPESSTDTFCIACQYNRTVPNLSSAENIERWRLIEKAKRRLFYTLLRLNLPLTMRPSDEQGLAWDFLSDTDNGVAAPPVLTGHFDGLITINIAEADDAERESRRVAMHEPYRTLLGHFRHEVGHYFWITLIERNPNASVIERFRAVFGDERQDYGAALGRHYANGAPQDWQENWISAYASAHPWEDWAETWAHYLHMVDTLETASAFGLRLKNRTIAASSETVIDFDPHHANLESLIAGWLPLTFAANSINRSMGQKDLYPFVMTPVVVSKLAFIHEMIRAASGQTIPNPDDELRAIAAALRLRVPIP